jgi:hypothetical protein
MIPFKQTVELKFNDVTTICCVHTFINRYSSKLGYYIMSGKDNFVHIALLNKHGGNSKYIVQKHTPKKYETKEFFSYVLIF